MCGVAGMWHRGAREPESLQLVIARMSGSLVHRGPDADGEWIDAAAGIALSHRRLAVLDLSPAGHQPMISSSGRFVIAFNGEIYNFLQLRDALAGVRFRGHSDTEVLLEAIEAWGLVGALRRCAGMFAFALWDRSERTLRLVRDRLGEKPLYYGWLGETLLFGSELRALEAHPRFAGEIDTEALGLYLRQGNVPSPRSIYRNVRKLPPASVLTVRSTGEAELASYWSAREAALAGLADPLGGSAEDVVDALEFLLRQVVGQQMVADVPLGAFLSGGIDSSTVVALMQEQSPRPIRTFTIGFHEPGYDEAAHARRVASHLGADHTELYLTPAEAQAVIPRLSRIYDEPFADASQIPTFLLAELTRRSVTVSLTGDGGDELFAGYNRHVWGRRLWPWLRLVPARERRRAGELLRRWSPDRWDALLRPLMKRLPRSHRLSLPGQQVHKLAGILDVASPEALYRALVSSTPLDESLLRDGPSELPAVDEGLGSGSMVDQMMFFDLVGYLPDDNLVKVDRACMAVSLESRAPFLDHRIVELAWRVPLRLKLRRGVGKWLLRQLLYRRVPRALIDRPKMGFAVPVHAWLRGPLKEWAADSLAPARLRREGLLDADRIARAWDEHRRGVRNWDRLLWSVLMFEGWLADRRARAADVAVA
jgi:asparagine synthase (glutamine-hydrolysing)